MGFFFLPINLSNDSFEFLATILHVINIPNRSIKGLQPLMVVHEVPAETHGPADGQWGRRGGKENGTSA